MTETPLRDRARQGGRREQQPSAQVARRDDGRVTTLMRSDVYRDEFTAALPAHVDVDAFLTGAQGALKKNADLQEAAERKPASFFQALREAARLGHVPGSKEYHLTVRGGAVLGIEDYRGVIERIYRAGAAASVVVEPVHERDRFRWVPGEMDRPTNDANWFGDRGPLLGAYAYAVMKDGATSKVVIVDQERIDRAKRASATAGKSHSPWASDYRSMVLKTAAHDLEKWVPTSSEYRRELLRAEAAVIREEAERRTIDVPVQGQVVVGAAPRADVVTGEILEDEPLVLDAPPPDDEPVDPETGELPPEPVASSELELEPPEPTLPVEPPKPPVEPASKVQVVKIQAMFAGAGITDREMRLRYCADVAGRDIDSTNDLTKAEASQVIDALTREGS